VVSVFVNPTQFDEQADLLAYPRDLERDAGLAAEAGADLVFAPMPEEIYPPGFCTTVEVHGLTDRLEGAVRGSEHFAGVSTVVCKLLNIVSPEVAFFGQKDAQQVAVVQRMVADLDIDVEVVTMPTVRERDGLAMSSRNARLSAEERQRALALYTGLTAAQRLADDGERSARALIAAAERAMAQMDVQPEYAALVDGESFEDMEVLDHEALMLVAARIGQTRLIDNLLLQPVAAALSPAAERPLRQQPKQKTKNHPDQGKAIAACSA
jgi:pantoate--beta-alanine ligase